MNNDHEDQHDEYEPPVIEEIGTLAELTLIAKEVSVTADAAYPSGFAFDQNS